MTVKQVTWTRYEGKEYGVAVDSNLNPLGNVIIEKRVRDFYITAYNFLNESWSVQTVPLSGEPNELNAGVVRTTGEIGLLKLLAA